MRAPRRTIACAVRIDDLRDGDGVVPLTAGDASPLTVGRDDERRIERAVVPLAGVVSARDDEVERHARVSEGRQLAGGCGEEAPLAGDSKRIGRSGDEEDEVVSLERQRHVREQFLAEHRDRPFPALRRRASTPGVSPRPTARGRRSPSSASRRRRSVPQLVVTERGEELAATGEERELARDDGAAARGLGEHLRGMDDLARVPASPEPGRTRPIRRAQRRRSASADHPGSHKPRRPAVPTS